LGEELSEQFSADVELIASNGGVFEVLVDGKVFFSKKSLNRFPEEGEVVGLIKG